VPDIAVDAREMGEQEMRSLIFIELTFQWRESN
jgi:hypothetical protein